MNPIVTVTREDQVAVVAIDHPPVNVFSRSLRKALLEVASEIAVSADVRAVVLLCRGKTFVSGADLSEFDTGIAAPDYYTLFDAIESLAIPVVAAMHGTALGAGVELALACHYRIAATDAQLGMPEITLGVVPGAGGTQRLTRLVGARCALDLLLSGKSIKSTQARAIGLIDAVSVGELRDDALSFAKKLANQRGRQPRRTRDLIAKDAEDSTFAAAIESAARTLRGRTTPALTIEAVRAASSLSFDEGLRREHQLSSRSLRQDESRALRHLFFAQRQTSKLPFLKPEIRPRSLDRIAVVGDGCFADDVAKAFIDNGFAATQVASDQDADGVRDADLIVDATSATLAASQDLLRKLSEHAHPGSILVSTSSNLDLNEIANVTARPCDVVGLHFVGGADGSRVLEIVRGERTADDVVVSAFSVARRLRKIGVLTGVGDGLIADRMTAACWREVEFLLLEGASSAQIGAAVANLWTTGFIARQTSLAQLTVEPSIASRRRQLGVEPRVLSNEEVERRCLYRLIDEGSRILEEGIARRAADIDVLCTSGCGFPRHRGGPMFSADVIGLTTVLSDIEQAAAHFGASYPRPAPLLKDLALDGKLLHQWTSPGD